MKDLISPECWRATNAQGPPPASEGNGDYEVPYKDANRDWWKLTVVRDRPAPNTTVPEQPDHYWRYTLAKQDNATGQYLTWWRGEVWAVNDMPPTIEAVMAEFARDATRLAIGLTGAF